MTLDTIPLPLRFTPDASRVEHWRAQLDFVICVGTSTAHLAASAGKPCSVLLPARDVDWRWMHGRDDSPWYPQTLRLFMQGLDEPWGAVAERVKEACATMSGA